ncbi:MAG: helix-turn-helix transcriptional regulator [Coriobacteriia bacterium]|nr:helix-turn-helix transcriptional regulator [Coriobacteriia bacterium]
MPTAYINARKLREVALLIRSTRTTMDMTQEDLAKSAGCSKSLISRIERGERSLTIQKADALSVCLGLPKRELIDGATDQRVMQPWLLAPLPRSTHWVQVADHFQGLKRPAAMGLLRSGGSRADSVVQDIFGDVSDMVRLLQVAAFEHIHQDVRAAARGALVRVAKQASETESPFRTARGCDQ